MGNLEVDRIHTGASKMRNISFVARIETVIALTRSSAAELFVLWLVLTIQNVELETIVETKNTKHILRIEASG